MKLDLDGIEARAKAATHGEWRSGGDGSSWVSSPRGYIYYAAGAGKDADRADAAHIAGLSPDVALALVARMRRLERIADYADHTYHCGRNNGRECNCGFEEARK